MKKNLNKVRNIIVLLFVTISFTSCYDFLETYDLSSNNKAIYDVNMDLGQLVGTIYAMGMNDMENDPQFAPKDTTIYFRSFTDTSSILNAEQKSWLTEAKVDVKMDLKKELFKIAMNIPFKSITDLDRAMDPANQNNLQSILGKVMREKELGFEEVGQDQEEDLMEEDADDATQSAPIQDKLNLLQNIYSTSFKNGKIERKFDSTKYAIITQEKDFQQLQQFSAMMGDMKIQSKFILPRAVTNMKGQNMELAADKKSVIVSYKFSDLFETPENGNFVIEY